MNVQRYRGADSGHVLCERRPVGRDGCPSPSLGFLPLTLRLSPTQRAQKSGTPVGRGTPVPPSDSGWSNGRLTKAVEEGAGGGVPGTQHGAAPKASEAPAQRRFTRRRCSRGTPTGTLNQQLPQLEPEFPAPVTAAEEAGDRFEHSAATLGVGVPGRLALAADPGDH